jgi:hypothetical protein
MSDTCSCARLNAEMRANERSLLFVCERCPPVRATYDARTDPVPRLEQATERMESAVYEREGMTIIDHPSPNHGFRRTRTACEQRVDTILVHHTDSKTDGGSLSWLCLPKGAKYKVKQKEPDGSVKDVEVMHDAPVSAHYLVGTAGTIWRLVPEELSAWHAGMGRLPWETCPAYDFNHRSIGIEVVNPGDGKTPFTEAQYLALAWLVPDIVRRLSLGTLTMPDSEPRTWRGVTPEVTAAGVLYPGQVLGHRHVAPGRKTDPADNFDWARIREALAPTPRVG